MALIINKAKGNKRSALSVHGHICLCSHTSTIMGPLHLAIVLVCVALVSAQLTTNKTCPDVQTQEEFEVDKYVGLWYEIKKLPNMYQLQGKCDTAWYNKLENGTVEVINRMCLYNNTIRIVGNARGESEDSIKEGRFNVSFPVMGNRVSPYYVLGTDYGNYSVVWSCEETGVEQSTRFLWVLGKTTTLNEEHLEKVNKIIKDADLIEEFMGLTDTDHKECCYDATKYDDGNSAASVGFSVALLVSTVMVRFL